jgi:hypothetical protein
MLFPENVRVKENGIEIFPPHQFAIDMSERRDHTKNLSGNVRIELFAKSFILKVHNILATHNSKHRGLFSVSWYLNLVVKPGAVLDTVNSQAAFGSASTNFGGVVCIKP